MEYSTDPALWEINESFVLYCLKKGPAKFRNKDNDFRQSLRSYEEGDGKKKNRSLQKSLFNRTLKNGEVIDREWLLYSPSTGSVFCFVCRLFSKRISQFGTSGIDDWRNGTKRIKEHEDGSEHKEGLITYSQRKTSIGCIDDKLMQQFDAENSYWKNLLHRLIIVIKFIATRGLAFRGSNEELGSKKNGNYLGFLELISSFDPFLKNHFQVYGNKGHGYTWYLSANICEEIIEIMAKKLLNYIINDLKKKYIILFALILRQI